jgi:hypothetical protein
MDEKPAIQSPILSLADKLLTFIKKEAHSRQEALDAFYVARLAAMDDHDWSQSPFQER